MRLRNNKNAKDIINNSKYVILNPEENISSWNKVFGNKNPIHIEIGMGKGDFIIGMAKLHPEINFIGIEMYDTVLMYAVKKLEKLDIPNLRLIRMDANDIDKVFKKEISLIYLNFSDPWPKNRNAKRRLTHERLLSKYDSIFKKDKVIHMKTDNIKLFAFSIESLSNYGYKLQNVTLDLHSEDIENVETEYEKKFSSQGIRINRLEAYK
jgi:tRNA (guanine-N7-)-methyltransferase